MSAATVVRPWDPPVEGRRLGPAEGWLTVAMVIVLVESFVWALQDAGWVPSAEGSTSHLTYLALVAIFIELLGAKAGWGRWRTHLVAGVIGGLLLLWVAAVTVLSVGNRNVNLTDVVGLYQVSGQIVARVWRDLVIDGRAFTTEFGHYHMVFGALVWGAAMVATSAVFQRRRPFDAVVVVGVLLLTNMAILEPSQLPYLVLFTIAALILLVRAHTFDEQLTWVRRRIGDPASVSSLYLRGGTAFITLAIVGALLLTEVASSAPLQGLWHDLPSRLSGLAELLQKIAPSGGTVRPLGATSFQSTALLNGIWEPADGVAFTVAGAPSAAVDFKWLAGTYAEYDGTNRWAWGQVQPADVAAGVDVLAGTADDASHMDWRHPITVTITPVKFQDPTILSPATIETVDVDTTVRTVGGNRLTTVESRQGTQHYTVTALIPTISDAGLTANKLRVTPRTYPDDVSSTYRVVRDGTLGAQALRIYTTVKGLATNAAPSGLADNPYDFAKQLEQYLSTGPFQYEANVADAVRKSCAGLSSVECFATIRQGYCEFYATFMAILLRHDGIPSRIAYGFLRGDVASDGTETVPASKAHWWVQAYFAGFGWIDFDPTGGGVGVPESLPAGPVVTPGPAPSFGPAGSGDNGRDENLRPGARGGPAGTPPSASTGSGPFIVIAILLLVAAAVVVLAARRRGPRTPMDAERAWGGLGRLASRFGYGPRPAQTVYEYAGALGDTVPAMRAELQTVARAKVEVAYGRQQLSVDRMRAVGEAYRRLRLAIVRRGLAGWSNRGRKNR